MSIMKISGHDHRATINDAISKSAFMERWPPPEGYVDPKASNKKKPPVGGLTA
jgi:hypothetical protein